MPRPHRASRRGWPRNVRGRFWQSPSGSCSGPGPPAAGVAGCAGWNMSMRSGRSATPSIRRIQRGWRCIRPFSPLLRRPPCRRCRFPSWHSGRLWNKTRQAWRLWLPGLWPPTPWRRSSLPRGWWSDTTRRGPGSSPPWRFPAAGGRCGGHSCAAPQGRWASQAAGRRSVPTICHRRPQESPGISPGRRSRPGGGCRRSEARRHAPSRLT